MHLGTILLLFKSSLIVGAVCFLYVRFRGDRAEGLGVLAASFSIQAVATTIAGMVQQGNLSGDLWIIFNFSAGLAGYCLLWIGLKELTTGTHPRFTLISWAPPVASSAALIVTNSASDDAVRATMFNITAGSYLLASAFMVISDLKREKLNAKIPLGLSLALGALLCFAIACSSSGVALAWPPIDIIFFLLILLFFIICLFIIIMVKERAEAELHRLLATDDLTGIPNRRHFFKNLPSVLNDGDAFLVLDIDHFKRVNDTFGHARGDTVLCDVAASIASGLPSNAVFGRLGGEEFGIFLPLAGAEAALKAAETVRANVEARGASLTAPYSPTISAGIAIATRGAVISDVMSLADACLYKAKQNGRNRVHLHAPA